MGLTFCMANESIMNNILIFQCISFRWCIKNAWQNIFPFFLRGIVAILFYARRSLQKQSCSLLRAAILALSCTFKRKLASLHCISYGKPQRWVFSWNTHWKWTQTMDQYPTALRKWVFLQEQNFMGLSAFPLPIHLPLCVVCERWIVGTSTWITQILNCSNSRAKAGPRQDCGLLSTAHNCTGRRRLPLPAELITRRYVTSLLNRSLAKHMDFRSQRLPWKMAW